MILRRSTSILAAVVALTLAGCGGRHAAPLAPSDPETTVRTFLDAVRARSLAGMGELWGSSRGPATRWMARDQLEQRLTVIRVYLEHDRFDLLQPDAGDLGVRDTRTVRVRLYRKGCRPVVPFTLLSYRGGWLISDIDLAAAGNPERRCA